MPTLFVHIPKLLSAYPSLTHSLKNMLAYSKPIKTAAT